MNSNRKTAEMENVKINVKMKLSALWVTVMFCYLYADVKGFYLPGFIEKIMAGEVLGMQITQVFLLGSSIIMAIPAVKRNRRNRGQASKYKIPIQNTNKGGQASRYKIIPNLLDYDENENGV